MGDWVQGRGTLTITGYVPAMSTNLAIATDAHQPALGQGRVQTMMRQDNARMGAGGQPLEPDHLHGQRVPLWLGVSDVPVWIADGLMLCFVAVLGGLSLWLLKRGTGMRS